LNKRIKDLELSGDDEELFEQFAEDSFASESSSNKELDKCDEVDEGDSSDNDPKDPPSEA
jgi:hypothetical protein